jgi:hypothetical protein
MIANAFSSFMTQRRNESAVSVRIPSVESFSVQEATCVETVGVVVFLEMFFDEWVAA